MISLKDEEINLLGKSFVEVDKDVMWEEAFTTLWHSAACYVGLQGFYIGLDQRNTCINMQQFIGQQIWVVDFLYKSYLLN